MEDLLAYLAWLPFGALALILALIVLGLYLSYQGRSGQPCKYRSFSGETCKRQRLDGGHFCDFHNAILLRRSKR